MATALRDPQREAAQAVEAYLAANQAKSLLRFITCGSVDDGKSTLIGRLLHDSKMLFEDQLAALENESKKFGTQGEAIDFALLVDGLAAEREQGITIDVAYRFFATDRRKFIVADTPGHEQYTRNMVTGASTADLAVILIDARKGVLTQTRRHSYLVHLLGIRNIVLAVNKMDLVGYDQERFDKIVADYRAFAREAGIEEFTAIPLAAIAGDNVVGRTQAMAWYRGPALLEHLERVPVARARSDQQPFRMPVQWVNRPDQNFRGYAGTIASGVARPGDEVVILPSGQTSRIERIVTFDGDLAEAAARQSVTLTLADEVDCSRGDLIAIKSAPIGVSDRIEATLVWMAGEAMIPGRAYWLKIGTRTVSASIAEVHDVIDPNSMSRTEGRPLELNDIGDCAILLDRPVAALTYADNRQLGGFILIDRASHATVAAGLISGFDTPLDQTEAEAAPGRVIRLTGLDPARRADFALKAHQRLLARGRPSFILDEALLREGLSSDLGDSEADAAENRRRLREVAELMSRAGVTVLLVSDEAADDSAVDVASADYSGDWII